MELLPNQITKWQNSFNDAVDFIQSQIAEPISYPNDKDYVAYHHFARWLASTQINPFSFCPDGWGEYRESPLNFQALLHMIHHALVDDGDISFVNLIISGELKMSFFIFKCRSDDDFQATLLNLHGEYIKSWLDASVRLETFKGTPEDALKEGDVSFEVHHDAIQFCADVDLIEAEDKRRAEGFNKWVDEWKAK